MDERKDLRNLVRSRKMLRMAKTGSELLAQKAQELGSQSEVARQSGVSPSRVNRIIHEGAQPTLDTAFRFRDALGIPLDAWRRKARRASGGPRRQTAPSPATERKAS